MCKAFIGQIGDLIVDPSNEQAVWITVPVPIKVANTIQKLFFEEKGVASNQEQLQSKFLSPRSGASRSHFFPVSTQEPIPVSSQEFIISFFSFSTFHYFPILLETHLKF